MSQRQSVQQVVEEKVTRFVMGLPPRVQRVLAGRPEIIDGQTLATDVQLMLRLQRVARMPAVETLPVAKGREMLDHQTHMIGGDQPVGAVRDLTLEGLAARLYVPTGMPEGSPLMVFFHGGGFLYGGLESHDATCRLLAERARVRVLAIDYRMAPEAVFPAAHDDAVAAYRWAVAHADELDADPRRMIVAGDSAGGNLTIAVAIAAAREGLPLQLQVPIYPVSDMTSTSRSRRLFGAEHYLTTEFIDLANRTYVPEGTDKRDPRLSPLYADLPAGLAPAYVATAGFDPLRDEGEAYARKLSEAGVPVELRRFSGQIHGFVNGLVLRSMRAALVEIADAVRERTDQVPVGRPEAA